MLVLSRPQYSELALECRQKVKSKKYFAQVSNSTTKFLSVNIAWTYYKYFVKSHCMIIRMLNTSDMISFHHKVFRMASIFPLDSSNIHILNSYASMECIFLTIHFSNFKFRAKMTCYEYWKITKCIIKCLFAFPF